MGTPKKVAQIEKHHRDSAETGNSKQSMEDADHKSIELRRNNLAVGYVSDSNVKLARSNTDASHNINNHSRIHMQHGSATQLHSRA